MEVKVKYTYCLKLLLTLTTLFFNLELDAQIIEGQLRAMPNQPLKLFGFKGLQTYTIAETQTNATGHFTLAYTEQDYGVGALIGPNQQPCFVLLTPEKNILNGVSLAELSTLDWPEGIQNQRFAQYASEHAKRQQALIGWEYMRGLYQDSLFEGFSAVKIDQEISRITAQDSSFIAQLPDSSYVRWYLPARKLVSSVSTVKQYFPHKTKAAIESFRKLNYADDRLYKSGLLKDAIESHFWLIENSGLPLDSVFVEMHASIDAMLKFLMTDAQKLNEVTDYLFDLLERHSLFQASEYLALKLLNETSCTIDSDLAKQLETYRAMKKGNTAPDIVFEGLEVLPGSLSSNLPDQLSTFKARYRLVVFGAGWCSKCVEEIPELAALYPKWKALGLEVVLVSLDDDQASFHGFAKDFPFMSICDYKKWESPMVTDYYVFGTPTMYLLDESLEILLRPTSVNQVEAWVDWFLLKEGVD